MRSLRTLSVALNLVEASLVQIGLQPCSAIGENALDPYVTLRSRTARPSPILLIDSNKRVRTTIPQTTGKRRSRLAVVGAVGGNVSVFLDVIGSVWDVLRLGFHLLLLLLNIFVGLVHVPSRSNSFLRLVVVASLVFVVAVVFARRVVRALEQCFKVLQSGKWACVFKTESAVN